MKFEDKLDEPQYKKVQINQFDFIKLFQNKLIKEKPNERFNFIHNKKELQRLKQEIRDEDEQIDKVIKKEVVENRNKIARHYECDHRHDTCKEKSRFR